MALSSHRTLTLIPPLVLFFSFSVSPIASTPYNPQECQRKHWPEHKIECVKQKKSHKPTSGSPFAVMLKYVHANRADLRMTPPQSFQFANAESTPEQRMQKVSKSGTWRRDEIFTSPEDNRILLEVMQWTGHLRAKPYKQELQGLPAEGWLALASRTSKGKESKLQVTQCHKQGPPNTHPYK